MLDTRTIKILVVDHHSLVCSGIAEILHRYADFEVVGRAESIDEAVRICEQLKPDVITIDIDLPDRNGAVRVIHYLHNKHPQAHVLVLTNNLTESVIHDALRAGAVSYLLKDITVEELSHAIRSAYQGQSTLSPEITQILVHAVGIQEPSEHNLTERECQVLELITQGRTNHEIGGALSISISTVQFHVRNILSKLGVHNRIEAATLMIRKGREGHST